MPFYVLSDTSSSSSENLISSELELSNSSQTSRNSIHKKLDLCFIYSGFLPVGRFLYRSYYSKSSKISKCIHEVRALTLAPESMIHESASEVLHAIHLYILSISDTTESNIFRIMITTCDQFYSSFSSLLEDKHWSHVSSLKHIYCQPSIALDYWQSQYRLLEKIYRRNKKSKIRIVDFSSLSSSEWNSITTVPHPVWASPSHPSLETEYSSASSFVAFLDAVPCAWLIANDARKNCLTIETIWIDKSICSSAILYSMIFLSFSSFFGYIPSCSKSFQFAYLTSNKKMKVFSKWLQPFQTSSSFIHTYDSSITSSRVVV